MSINIKDELSTITNKAIKGSKSLEALFNHVPGGIVMYEWDGKHLKTLHISEYYAKQYGSSLVSKGANEGGPDFMRVHPDDLEKYQEAIIDSLNGSHQLEYVYRVWNDEARRYLWVKLNAVSETQPDGTSLVYAMYSDITEQKDAELKLEKSKASLSAALGASNQLCYEYDPAEHVAECYTETNFFNLPRRIENYPDSLLEYDLFHPDDAHLFIEAAKKMDGGDTKAHCDVRIKKGEEYCWYSCNFDTYHDLRKERNVSIITVVDISLRVSAVESFEKRFQSFAYANENSLCIGAFNLSRNSFSRFQSKKGVFVETYKAETFDELMEKTSEGVPDYETRCQYRALFNCRNMLELAQQGQRHVQMQHLYQIEPERLEWVETAMDFVRNPITGDFEGIGYSKSVNTGKIANLLLEKTLRQDFIMAAVFYQESSEYYLFDSYHNQYGAHHRDFWTSLGSGLRGIADKNNLDRMDSFFEKEAVLSRLKKEGEFAYAFDGKVRNVKCRLEIRFSYLDEGHGFVLATIRNITDRILLDKLRYDARHDQLTGLYNRKTVFAKCRELMDDHPDDTFAMLHFDIRRFRLYNAFFGDKAGDKLLCDIADMLRNMDKDYEYWAYGRIDADVFCAFFPYKKQIYYKHLDYLLDELKNYRDDFLFEPSIGVYFVDDKGMSVESMFTRATTAAKENRFSLLNADCRYTAQMEEKMAEERQILNEMQTGIDKEQFQVYLQPQYDLQTNKPVGAEALVRWAHPLHGIILPSKFIPLFERNGFIITLDQYVWEKVCKLMRKWLDEGKQPVPVSVNVSRVSMYSPNTVQFLKNLVTRYNLDPKYIQLELMETAYMDDPLGIKSQLSELQEFGFNILMDDFGSAYSSLNTLRELPVDFLKLDMKFLSPSSDDQRGRIVLISVIRMAKLLNLKVIAEGVETEKQADYLRTIGCEYVQGYLFSRPMPVEEYEERMLNQMVVVPDKGIDDSALIRRLLTDNSDNMRTFTESVPVPMAFVEFKENSLLYMRSNSLFWKKFRTGMNSISNSQSRARYISDSDYEILLDAYAQCAHTHQPVNVAIHWKSDDEPWKKYAVGVIYKGKLVKASVLAVSFTDIDDL